MTPKAIWESSKSLFTAGEMQAMQEMKQQVMDYRKFLAGSQSQSYTGFKHAEQAKENEKKREIL